MCKFHNFCKVKYIRFHISDNQIGLGIFPISKIINRNTIFKVGINVDSKCKKKIHNNPSQTVDSTVSTIDNYTLTFLYQKLRSKLGDI